MNQNSVDRTHTNCDRDEDDLGQLEQGLFNIARQIRASCKRTLPPGRGAALSSSREYRIA